MSEFGAQRTRELMDTEPAGATATALDTDGGAAGHEAGTTGAAAAAQAAELAGTETENATPEEAQAEETRQRERQAQAQADWNALLGESLGAKAWEAIQEHVSLAALNGYAQQGTEAMRKALEGGVLKPTDQGAAGGLMDEKSEADAVNALIVALAPAIQEAANAWLASESGQRVLGSISEWVEDNPLAVTLGVAGLLVAAATTVYVTNMDLPEFAQKFKLTEHLSGEAGVDIGPIQDATIQAARLGLNYRRNGFDASVLARYTAGEDGGASVTGRVGYEDEDENVDAGAEATWREGGGLSGQAHAGVEGRVGEQTTANVRGDLAIGEDGRTTVTVLGGMETLLGNTPVSGKAGASHASGGDGEREVSVNGELSVGETGERTRLGGTFDPGSRAFNLSLSREFLEGRLTQTNTVGRDAQGGATDSTAIGYREGDTEFAFSETNTDAGTTHEVSGSQKDVAGSGVDVSGRHRTGPDGDSTQLGAGFDLGRFRTELDAQMERGVTTMGLNTEADLGQGYTAGAGLRYDLTEDRITEWSTRFGFQDPERFRSFTLEYHGRWLSENQEYAHGFNAAYEQSMGNLSGRLRAGLDLQGSQVQGGNVDALAGYRLNDRWAVIGGANYTTQRGNNGQMNGQFTGRAGVQYKDIAITVTGSPGAERGNTFGIQLEIPLGFGRR